MRKRAYFASRNTEGWPAPAEIERYFLAPPGEEWFYTGRNDSGSFTAEGVDGTDHLSLGQGRIDIRLALSGNPDHGVLLVWSKKGGGNNQTYTSKGNLARLREFVRTLQDTPLPVGLFVPFDRAWVAVREFLENDGALPKGIEWIADEDLPPNTFPGP